jgi:glutamine amidotransferase
LIVIVDYQMGNVGSIANMLKKIGFDSLITSDPARIQSAEKLILPGVGAFDTGMTNLEHSGLLPILNEKVRSQRTPVLGICLGMELLTSGSDEGVCPGLGWIEGRTVRFRFDEAATQLNVPHMGWNSVRPAPDSVLLRGLPADNRFYFVHSYHVVCDRDADVGGWTRYGEDFASVVERGNVMGTQFHPEKSHRFGMALLRNFAALG